MERQKKKKGKKNMSESPGEYFECKGSKCVPLLQLHKARRALTLYSGVNGASRSW